MTNTGITNECEDCGATDVETELHAYVGPRRKKYLLPRCVDRAACAVRQKAERAALVQDVLGEVADAASDLDSARREVKAMEKALAKIVKYALQEGAPATSVAQAARLSRQRVYQIRDGSR